MVHGARVQGYFNTLRMELADRNIDVTMVCPGPVESEVGTGGTAHVGSRSALCLWNSTRGAAQ